MGEKLIITPEVRAVIREGRADERAFNLGSRLVVPYGLRGEDLPKPERILLSGAKAARQAQQQ